MLIQAQNDALTRVGSGVPAGELLRRYWQPVAVGGELTEDGGVPLGVVEAGRQGAVIELKVINERIGLITPEK